LSDASLGLKNAAATGRRARRGRTTGGGAMEMHQIRYFLALCEELNFTKAAERCNVAQPSLTRAIKLLEEEFSGALVNRERANTHLTELGRLMRPHLADVYEQAQLARSEARKLKTAKRLTLRLGVMCTIAPAPLLALMDGLGRRHPELDLEVVDATARDLEERLKRDELEVAIYCRPDHSDDRLHYHRLFRERMMVVVAPAHPLACRNPIRLQELDNQRYLNRINCEFNEGLAWEQCGVTWPAVFRSERDDWILAMCAAGKGFGFLPEFCINHPGVVSLSIIDPEFWREVSIVTVRGRQHSPAVGALVREAMRNNWVGEKGERPGAA
jgi:LysR family transcriptional regulator, hydrogen peroxide-inducible genes activator